MIRPLVGTLAPLSLLVCGCGFPLSVPAVQRLDAQQQPEVDGMWNNMLATPDRLERDVLLDTVMMFALIHSGVDSLTMRSAKAHAGGTVVMTVTFDRARPTADAFTVELFDRRGLRVRTERYAATEVLDRVRDVMPGQSVAFGTADGSESPEERLRLERMEARLARVVAATQPAR